MTRGMAAAVAFLLFVRAAVGRPQESRPHSPSKSVAALKPSSRSASSAADLQQVGQAKQLLRTGSTQKAVALLRDTLRRDPNNADAQLLLGVALAQLPEESEALQELRRAVALRPGSAHAYYVLGTALARFVRLREAQQAFEKAIELDPHFADAHVSLGLIFAQQKKLAAARQQFEQALKLQGEVPAAGYTHFLLARVDAEQKNYLQAERELEAALRLRPHYAEAYLSLGMAHANLNDNRGALQDFEEAARFAPDTYEAQFQLGSALFRADRSAEAVPHLELALKLRPDDQRALLRLCPALKRAGRTQEASACQQRVTAIIRTEAAANDQLLAAGKFNNEGVRLEKQGDVADALEKYRAAVKLDPNEITFRRNLALVLCRAGRWNEGIVQLRRVLKEDPGDPQARKALYIAFDKVRSSTRQNAPPKKDQPH